MKKGILKLCILVALSFFTRPIYANEMSCGCMEYEDLKTEQKVHESPESLKLVSEEFAEQVQEILTEEGVLLAEI